MASRLWISSCIAASWDCRDESASCLVEGFVAGDGKGCSAENFRGEGGRRSIGEGAL